MRLLVLVIAIAVLLAAAGIVSAWAPERSVDSLKARWAPPPSRFIALQGMMVHVRDQGPRDDPLPIVLIHGTSASLHTWEGWVGALERTRRVITMDIPGFGLTGPDPEADYRIRRYVRFITGLLDTLGVERCVLGGNSLGGEIAWNVAVDAPRRVAALILVDSGGYAFESRSVPLGFRIARVPLLRNLVAHLLPRGMVAASVRNVYGNPSLVTDALVDRYYELTLRAGNRRALAERFSQLRPGANAARIPTIAVPTLILWGGRDRLIPLAYGERFAHDIKGSVLVSFDDLGHVPQEEDPARTVVPVEQFLARVAPR
ncbi:MAG TPA: alpha/beta fold hydrolase [Burkholderiales bacterium]|nr:alpha/beta fold hydrolase [Burkholderiales bacterium]